MTLAGESVSLKSCKFLQRCFDSVNKQEEMLMFRFPYPQASNRGGWVTGDPACEHEKHRRYQRGNLDIIYGNRGGS